MRSHRIAEIEQEIDKFFNKEDEVKCPDCEWFIEAIQELMNENDLLERECEDLGNEKDKLIDDIDELKDDNNQLEERIGELQKENETLESDVADLAMEVRSLRRELDGDDL